MIAREKETIRMKKRLLGKTGIELSEVGYGAAALFGKDVLGKQGISEERAYSLISTALSCGVTFFDTGINYGYSEERLGRCLSEAVREGTITRKDIVIETKCGETVNDDGSYGSHDWSPDWIKKSLEISLKRLRTEYIDLFAMHGGSISDCSDTLLNCFRDLKSQGLIRAFGINTFSSDVIDWIAENKVFDYVMLDYNIMKQDREHQIEKLYSSGVGVIAGAALGQSLYSRKTHLTRNDLWYTLRSMFKFKYMRQKSKNFKFLSQYNDYTANQLALRYVLDNEKISSATFNTTSVDHLIENLKAVDIEMPENISIEIKKRA